MPFDKLEKHVDNTLSPKERTQMDMTHAQGINFVDSQGLTWECPSTLDERMSWDHNQGLDTFLVPIY